MTKGTYLALMVELVDSLITKHLDTRYYASRSISRLRISAVLGEKNITKNHVLVTPLGDGNFDCELWVPIRTVNPGLLDPEFRLVVQQHQICTPADALSTVLGYVRLLGG